jgi:hypothetical protein
MIKSFDGHSLNRVRKVKCPKCSGIFTTTVRMRKYCEPCSPARMSAPSFAVTL